MAEAQIQQLHAQVTLLTSQVQHLNGIADGQAQKIEAMNDYEQLKQTVIQMQQQGVGAGGGRGGEDGAKYLVNIKEVKIDNFLGDESKFTDFIEDTKTYTDVIIPELGEILEWLEYQPKNLTENAVMAHVGHNFVNFNRTLSGFMKVRLRGKARNWLKAQPVGEGLLNWKKMLHKYDPMTGSTRLDLQNKITTPGARCASAKDVPAAIEAWDAAYQKYQQRMGHELDDEMMQNILLRKLPPKFEQTMRMNIQMLGRETNYASLRQEILDMCVHYVGTISTPMDLNDLDKGRDVPAEPSGWTDAQVWAWMEEEGYLDNGTDVDGLDRKGGKSKGKGKGGKNGGRVTQKGKGKGTDIVCEICERTGHVKKDCWCNPQSPQYKGEQYAKKVLEKLGKNVKDLKSLDEEDEDAALLEGLYDEDCDCLDLAALDNVAVSGEVPPPAEEPGGRGETQESDSEQSEEDSNDDSEGEDREELKDGEMDKLATEFGKISSIGKYPDPWSVKDPWQKSHRDVKSAVAEEIAKTQISDATKKFDEQLAEILKKQSSNSTKAVASQGDILGVSSTLSSATSPTPTCISNPKSSVSLSTSSPNSEPSEATLKFEKALKDLHKTEIIGKLKVKRDEIEASANPEVKNVGKRKSEEPHRPSRGSAADEDGAGGTPGRNRWRKSPEGRRVREAVTPSTPEMFDFDDLDISEEQEKKKEKKGVGKFDIGTPDVPKTQEAGIQVRPSVTETEMQTIDEEELDMSDIEYVDGVMCKHLCMAAPGEERAAKIGNHEKDENGFYKLKKGITSDSGAGDTVGPDEEFPDYPLEESPGSRRGLHYLAAGGEKIKNAGQKKVMILTAEKQLRWVTVQIAKVKKTLGSVSKSNDHGIDVCYSSKGSYMKDVKTQEKTALRRERGVFVLDAWVVPYEMAKTGMVKYKDASGKLRMVKINEKKNNTDFSRPAR